MIYLLVNKSRLIKKYYKFKNILILIINYHHYYLMIFKLNHTHISYIIQKNNINNLKNNKINNIIVKFMNN